MFIRIHLKKKAREAMNKLGKVYIAGRISGLSESEFKANFLRGVDKVRKLGVESRHIINPAKYTIDFGEWSEYMRLCLSKLLECDTIFMLEDYKESKGAKFELLTAETLGLNIVYESEVENEY